MGSKARIKLDELETGLVRAKGLELTIGKIIEEWEEEAGPTPMPEIGALREWDLKLLNKYKPFIYRSAISVAYARWESAI